MKLHYTVVLDREEDGRHIASVPGVPGCHVYGRTRQQAVGRARRALQFYLDVRRQEGRKPPKQPPMTAEVEVTA